MHAAESNIFQQHLFNFKHHLSIFGQLGKQKGIGLKHSLKYFVEKIRTDCVVCVYLRLPVCLT